VCLCSARVGSQNHRGRGPRSLEFTFCVLERHALRFPAGTERERAVQQLGEIDRRREEVVSSSDVPSVPLRSVHYDGICRSSALYVHASGCHHVQQSPFGLNISSSPLPCRVRRGEDWGCTRVSTSAKRVSTANARASSGRTVCFRPSDRPRLLARSVINVCRSAAQRMAVVAAPNAALRCLSSLACTPNSIFNSANSLCRRSRCCWSWAWRSGASNP